MGPGRKPRRPVFSERGSNNDCSFILVKLNIYYIKLQDITTKNKAV